MLLRFAPTVASMMDEVLLGTQIYKGVWVATEHRWWHMTTELESVLTHSEKQNWAGTHETREDVPKKEKKIAQQCDITGQAAHHKAPECTEKSQRDSDLYKNKISVHTFPWFTFQKDKMRLCLTTNDMYLSWICWHDPLQFYAKMGYLSREETIISRNGCLHWEVWPTRGGCPFSPSPKQIKKLTPTPTFISFDFCPKIHF